MRATLVTVCCLAAILFLSTSTSAPRPQQPPAQTAAVRPCKTSDENAHSAKKPAGKKKNRIETESVPVPCSEFHASSLQVQERVQALVRDLRWQIGDEDADESVLSFSLELAKDELLADARTDSIDQRVEWSRGRAVILVKTVELPDGYTRATISAKVRGFGVPVDKLAMQRTAWELNSSGRLEAALMEQLRSRFLSDH